MAFLENLGQITKIEWERSYLWDVKFESVGGSAVPPSPFSDWIPAVSVEDEIFKLNPFNFSAPGGSYSVAHMTDIKGITIEFHDDIDRTLLNWFEEWSKEILLEDEGPNVVNYLESIARTITIAKLDLDRSIISSNTYNVMPVGELNFSGNSESDTPTKTINFVKV